MVGMRHLYTQGYRILTLIDRNGSRLLTVSSNCCFLKFLYSSSMRTTITQFRMTSSLSSGRRQMGLGDAKKVTHRQKWKPRSKRRIPPRAEIINSETTDWSSIFPASQSFNQAVIPIPVRMGRPRYNRTGDVPPDARGNIELLKIPNFFHLTPVAIQKHCNALVEYCTDWPKSLPHLPIRITTINHIYSGPAISHPDSRKVKLQVSLKDLDLDEHAKKKFIRLVGNRYNPVNDELTLISDRCPTRKQNKEYAYYLLTAIYHEAWKIEEWESEIGDASEEDVDAKLEEVREELNPKLKEEKNVKRRFYRVVGDRVIRYNNVGHPFVFEMRKHGIIGGLQRDLLEKAKLDWNSILQNQEDFDTFDPIIWPRRGRQL